MTDKEARLQRARPIARKRHNALCLSAGCDVSPIQHGEHVEQMAEELVAFYDSEVSRAWEEAAQIAENAPMFHSLGANFNIAAALREAARKEK